MKYLRILAGVLITGPIGGIFGYIFTPSAIVVGSIATTLAFAIGAPFLVAAAIGTSAHAFTFIAETLFTAFNNKRLNKAKNVSDSVSDLNDYGYDNFKPPKSLPKRTFECFVSSEQVRDTPVAKAFFLGFTFANFTAGAPNHPYGQRAVKVLDFFNNVGARDKLRPYRD